jgi:hypothetical protein
LGWEAGGDYRIVRIKRDDQDFLGERTEENLTGCPGWAGFSGEE